MTDPVTSMASVVSLLAYLARILDRYQAGEMTAEEVAAAYDALAVRRDATKGIWQDAKAAGGYDA